MFGAAMARIASDANLIVAVAQLEVQVASHHNHVASHLLAFVVIARKVASYVAELALHSERQCVGLHDVGQPKQLQDFEVFPRRRGSWPGGSRCGLLRVEGNREAGEQQRAHRCL